MTYTDLKSSSILDNFFCNQGFLDKVVDAGPVHLGDNRSRHSPIMMKVDLGDLPTKQPTQEPRSCRKPAWYKASEENISEYTEMLHHRLASLSAPASLSCHDVNCQDEEHTRERDAHVLDIMCSITEASYECIPMASHQVSLTTSYQVGRRLWHLLRVIHCSGMEYG